MQKNNISIMRKGGLYLAFGYGHLVLALLSIYSFRLSNPNLSIHLITNIDVPFDRLDFWNPDLCSVKILPWTDDRNREVKTNLNSYTPFERTIFIDADTIILRTLFPLLSFLDEFDLCIKLNNRPQLKKTKKGDVIYKNFSTEDLPHWNSGIVVFKKNDSVDLFFDSWATSFKEIGSKFDQVSLAKSILNFTHLRFLSLDERWNSSGPIFGRNRWLGWAHVYHYTSFPSFFVDSLLNSKKKILFDIGLDYKHGLCEIKRRRINFKKNFGLFRYFILWAVSILDNSNFRKIHNKSHTFFDKN